MSFQFKYFQVEDSHSTMKVGTDSMLLGAWSNPGDAKSILDIGTGCGILSLMMAQKSDASVDAIDIHAPSVAEAKSNFIKSPWAERLDAFCMPLQEYAEKSGRKYDLIITNPPYFTGSLKPASEMRMISRHEISMSYSTLIRWSVSLMHRQSSLSLLLPVKQSRIFTGIAAGENLHPVRKLVVRPFRTKPPNLILMRFGFGIPSNLMEDELVIMTPEGRFTTPYLSLTRNFHQFAQQDR